jgi:hypothetical protein
MGERTPRYTLPGPCETWAVEGRDGRWYRVCVPCDTVIPAGGTLPRHLRYGYERERDAEMGVRDHVRQMTRNRAGYAMALDREAACLAAARAGDVVTFGRLVMRDPTWLPSPNGDEADRQRILADYVRRRDQRAH